METLDYNKSYQIQDEILDIFFEDSTEFYLTGGTCLSRFYYAKRYSVDLDFFTNYSSRFHFSIRSFLDRLSQKDIPNKIEIESKDFLRIIIREILQVDFINDRVKYIGKVRSRGKIIIDNVFNILANKVTAILYRDNIKDIFDLYLIAKNNQLDWTEVLESAQEKMNFRIEDFCDRQASFPRKTIYNLNLIDHKFLKDFNSEFDILIDDVLKGKRNSLCASNDHNPE